MSPGIFLLGNNGGASPAVDHDIEDIGCFEK